MIRIFASGADSAAAFAKSLTMDAFVLNKSIKVNYYYVCSRIETYHRGSCQASGVHQQVLKQLSCLSNSLSEQMV